MIFVKNGPLSQPDHKRMITFEMDFLLSNSFLSAIYLGTMTNADGLMTETDSQGRDLQFVDKRKLFDKAKSTGRIRKQMGPAGDNDPIKTLIGVLASLFQRNRFIYAAQILDMCTDLTYPAAAAMDNRYSGCTGRCDNWVYRVHAYPTVPSLLGSAAPRQPEDSRATVRIVPSTGLTTPL